MNALTLTGVIVLLTVSFSLAGVPSSNKPGATKAGATQVAANKAAQPKLLQLKEGKASATGILARLKKSGGNIAAANLSIQQALTSTGFAVDRTYLTIPRLQRLSFKSGVGVAALSKTTLKSKMKELMATGLYEYVEPDWQVHLLQNPTDSAFTDGRLWGLRNLGQSGGVSGIDVNTESAWSVTTGSPSVVVAVIDTGVRYTHRDLRNNMWVNTGEIPGNGIDDDNNGYRDDIHGINAILNTGDPMDDHGHGSHCSGTIAATPFDSGAHVGVAYNVKIMGCKFLGQGGGRTSDAITCIEYAVANGADLLSNSWGGGGFSQAMVDAIQTANNAGVLFIAAAGNDAVNNDQIPHYPSNYSVPNVISVAAIDRRGNLASFSCYGATTVDLAAPGVAIYSCTSDSDTSYATWNGTSMATPHVSGVAALLISQYPTMGVSELKSRLLNTAAPLASLSGRMITGGMVDAGAAINAGADGVLEVTASSNGPLQAGVSNTLYVAVSDLTPVSGALVRANFNGGSSVTFQDNGITPDVTANDGIYTGNLVAQEGLTSVSLNVSVTASGKSPSNQAFPFSIVAAPGNDRFANRFVLSGGATQTTGTNNFATSESNEPKNPSVAGGKTVWWQWTAGISGATTISTTGSSYDTTMAIYQGSSLGSLTLMGSNDDSSGVQSAVSFSAVAGTAYMIQVDGYAGSEGDIQLNYPVPGSGSVNVPVIVTQPVGRTTLEGDSFSLSVIATSSAPLSYQWKKNGVSVSGADTASYSVVTAAESHEGSYTVVISNVGGSVTSDVAFVAVNRVGLVPNNDDFNDAELITGASGRATGSNIRSTGQSNEPNHAGTSSPLASVWYAWTAPSNGIMEMNTFGSDFDTTLAAYRGSRLSSLTVVASNDDSSGVQSAVSYAVSVGLTYWIAIDGYMGAEGQLILDYTFTPDSTAVPNDNFANRIFLGTNDTTTTGENIGASGETGETSHAGGSIPLASVWWSWRAPSNGQVTISTDGSDFDTTMGVYIGSSVGGLSVVASNDDFSGLQSQVTFAVTAGTTYSIAVDGYGSGEGGIDLSVDFEGASDDHGDSTANATTVASNSTTAGEFEEGGDHDYFRIQISGSGTLTVGTTGSTDTYGTLYDSGGNEIASDDDSGGYPNFSISKILGAGTYFIRLRGYHGATTGDYTLVSSLQSQNPNDDHGDSIATATLVSINSTTSGNFETGGDSDYLRVVASTYGIITVRSTGSSDTFGEVLDSSGVTLVSDDDSGSGLNFMVRYYVAPGTYYIGTVAYSDTYTGIYQIVSSFGAVEIDRPGSSATPPSSVSTRYITTGTSKYSGFLTSGDGSRVLGYFKSIKVSKTGKLSAKMYFGGVAYSLKGLFDLNGRYATVVTPRNGNPAIVNLQLVRTPAGGYKVEGTVTVGNQTANVEAVRSGSTGSRAGIYTILILGDEDETAVPQGHGYALMTVTSVGTAKVKGLLGDGTKWTAKCYITPDGEMPLYAALYRKAGSLGGLVRFRNVSGVSDCDGEVHWFKPAGTGYLPYSSGFDLQRDLIGSRYQNTGSRLISSIPNTVPNVEAYVGAGAGIASSSRDLEWTTTNKIFYAGAEKVKVSVKTKSGQIKGYITDDGTKWKVAGVVFQKQDIGGGLVYIKRVPSRYLVIVPKE